METFYLGTNFHLVFHFFLLLREKSTDVVAAESKVSRTDTTPRSSLVALAMCYVCGPSNW